MTTAKKTEAELAAEQEAAKQKAKVPEKPTEILPGVASEGQGGGVRQSVDPEKK